VLYILQNLILGFAWWIYFTSLEGRRSDWRSKASLINLVLATCCAALLLLAVIITPEKVLGYDYVQGGVDQQCYYH
jgi:hypothetical protein